MILRVFMRDPQAPLFGLSLIRETGITSGSVYPLLHKMERLGWISSSWEEIDPVRAGRPPRRYYVLTREGADVAVRELSAAAGRLSLAGRLLSP
jgi:PadR family transcriptional regulator PadR